VAFAFGKSEGHPHRYYGAKSCVLKRPAILRISAMMEEIRQKTSMICSHSAPKVTFGIEILRESRGCVADLNVTFDPNWVFVAHESRGVGASIA
jgi:hypothetical protein